MDGVYPRHSSVVAYAWIMCGTTKTLESNTGQFCPSSDPTLQGNFFRCILPQKGTMIDTPAIIASEFGRGRVIAISPHSEASFNLESLGENLVDRGKNRSVQNEAAERLEFRKAKEAKKAVEILKQLDKLGKKNSGADQ